MKKKMICAMVVCAAIASFLFANKNNVSEVIASNVEALVDETGNEVYSRGCQRWLIEEWIEKYQDGSGYCMYTSSSGFLACDQSYERCYSKPSAKKGDRKRTCWHLAGGWN